MSRPANRNKKPSRRQGPLGDMTRIAPFLMRKGEETVASEILNHLKSLAGSGGGGQSSRDLAAALGYADGDDLVGFWHVLHNLHDKQEVSKDEARNYSLPSADELALTRALTDAKAQKAASLLTFKAGETYTGTLTANAGGYGFLRVEGYDQDIFLPNDQLGETLDGDTLEVRVPKKSDTRGGSDSGGRGGRSNRNGRDASSRPERFEGEIVSLVARRRAEIVGTLERRNREFVLVPDESRILPAIHIKMKDANGAAAGDKVVATDLEFTAPFELRAVVSERIGVAGESSTEVMAIARSRGIDATFPKDAVEEANQISEKIPQEEIDRRVDYRSKNVITIDPFDAKDFDDALSIEPLGKDEFLVGVHIADVSHFVREGTVLDAEAQRRATSVYLVDRVIPMLPSNLSEVICSLNPHVDRLAYSVLMRMDKAGEVLDYRIEKTVIHSKRRFTYEEVQEIITSGHGDFSKDIDLFYKLSKALMKTRFEEGAIDFDTEEVKFKLDKQGKPIDVIKKLRLDSHRLIEEFMLLANKVVARHVSKYFQTEELGYPAVYRIHDSPHPDRIRTLAAFVAKLGFKLELKKNALNNDTASQKAMKHLLAEVKGTPVEFMVNEITLRTMAKAIYSEKNIGHFGLGFDFYTHFTSPIRRYPDLITHRLLFEYEALRKSHAKLTTTRLGFLRRTIPAICQNSSEQEKNASDAERESIKLKQVEYITDHIGEAFEGVISGVTEFGVYVKIDKLMIEGMVHIRNLRDDYYKFDERSYSVVGERRGKRFQMGQRVKVQVESTDIKRKTIDFTLSP